jgi:hypothetical protein
MCLSVGPGTSTGEIELERKQEIKKKVARSRSFLWCYREDGVAAVAAAVQLVLRRGPSQLAAEQQVQRFLLRSHPALDQAAHVHAAAALVFGHRELARGRARVFGAAANVQ